MGSSFWWLLFKKMGKEVLNFVHWHKKSSTYRNTDRRKLMEGQQNEIWACNLSLVRPVLVNTL